MLHIFSNLLYINPLRIDLLNEKNKNKKLIKSSFLYKPLKNCKKHEVRLGLIILKGSKDSLYIYILKLCHMIKANVNQFS